MLSLGEEEAHNWIFSADQIGDEVAGMIKAANTYGFWHVLMVNDNFV